MRRTIDGESIQLQTATNRQRELAYHAYNRLIPPRCPSCEALVWVRMTRSVKGWIGGCKKCGAKHPYSAFMTHRKSYTALGITWQTKAEGEAIE